MLLVRKEKFPVCVLMSYIDIPSGQQPLATSYQGAPGEDLRPINPQHTQIHISVSQSVSPSVSQVVAHIRNFNWSNGAES